MTTLDIDALDWAKGDGLLPAIVQDAGDGAILMLGYMNRESLEKTLREGQVTFYSRSRQTLWRKGETSGNVLNLVDLVADVKVGTARRLAEREDIALHEISGRVFGFLMWNTRRPALQTAAVMPAINRSNTAVIGRVSRPRTRRMPPKRLGSRGRCSTAARCSGCCRTTRRRGCARARAPTVGAMRTSRP